MPTAWSPRPAVATTWTNATVGLAGTTWSPRAVVSTTWTNATVGLAGTVWTPRPVGTLIAYLETQAGNTLETQAGEGLEITQGTTTTWTPRTVV